MKKHRKNKAIDIRKYIVAYFCPINSVSKHRKWDKFHRRRARNPFFCMWNRRLSLWCKRLAADKLEDDGWRGVKIPKITAMDVLEAFGVMCFAVLVYFGFWIAAQLVA